MFLFLRLVLAHFIGDFLFQSDEVYEVKKKGFAGALVHYFIIFFTFLLFSFPYLKYANCWLVILFASLTHVLQDEIKLRYITNPKLNLFAFIADQIFHIIFLTPIFIFDFSNIVPESKNLLTHLYNNRSLIIFGIGCIGSIFMGAYIWESLKISYFKKPGAFEHLLVKYGMFERFVITTAFLNRHFLIFLAVPVVMHLCFKKLPLGSSFIFNIIFAGIIGFLLRRYLPIF